jgi:ATP-dependent Clp protease ATP-binding subunit ClpX
MQAHEIKKHLDEKVVGQEIAKVQLSVLLSMHLNWFEHEDRMHRSPNAILIGPTGVGKTHTIRVASEFLNIPYVAIDSTALVPSGIVGVQTEDILAELVMAANNIIIRENRVRYENDDIDLARRGIIFLDEFDKVAVRGYVGESSSSLQLVQRHLLKLIEGAILGVGVRRHDGTDTRSIDTSGILILSGGAFAKITDSSIRSKRPAQLQRDLSDPNVIVSADIVNYGFMPELVARLPILVEYKGLEESHLRSILDNPSVSPIQVWVDHFQQMGKTLTVDDLAKTFVANRAVKLDMGARGLQQILFPTLARIAYEIEESPSTNFLLSAEQSGLIWKSLEIYSDTRSELGDVNIILSKEG